MNKDGIMREIQSILDDAKTAVLATAGTDGLPHMRWVTPAILKGQPYSVFMITSPEFAKTYHIRENPKVEWMFQTRALDRIVNLTGRISIIDNPSLKSEVLEIAGAHLRTFWHINPDQHSMIVLETIINSATLFIPVKGLKENISF